MNLDDLKRFTEIDREGLIDQIDTLPDQLQAAWEGGKGFALGEISNVRRVLIAGMGGSAIGADLIAGYTSTMAGVPILIWRDYDLPGYISGPDTLVIASSHSGNTEETLSAFERGLEVNAQLLAITTGGKLERLALDQGVPVWRFDHPGPPRAAVGFSFGLILALLGRLGLIPEIEDEVADAVAAMRAAQKPLKVESPVVENPAKRMAGQFMGRWPTIVGAGFLAPVARRWRTQIAELAKSVAQFEAIPEADHNMLAGVHHPESLFGQTMVVFLRASLGHPRNQLRLDATKEVMMVEGLNTGFVDAKGDSRLAQLWTSLHFGDYTAYYLAMAYGVDPTPVEAIESLKEKLR